MKPNETQRMMTDAECRNNYQPNWKRKCQCGATPVVPVSGLCGPCHWGKAATINGGWWDEKKQDLADIAFD